jgi:hypothetical protein
MKRSLVLLSFLSFAALACSTTGPSTQVTGLWGYMASNLSDNEVVCSIAVPMTMIQADTNLVGTFSGSFMSCSSAAGASATLANGTVSGIVTLDSVSFSFQNTAAFNNGALSASVQSHSGSGRHLSNQATYEGTATMQMTLAGVAHTLTGTWVARQQ